MFAWGEGGNGKGVLFNTASRLLGDYAAVAPPDLLLVTQGDRHPTDMAMLHGRAAGHCAGAGARRAWDEPKLKSLTGGDPITARFMRQDFFTYMPQFTLLVAGNHKPSFRSVDEAIRRRVQLVPFLQNIPAERARPGAAGEAEGRVARHPALGDRRLPGVAAGRAQAAGQRARGERGLPGRRGRARAVARRTCASSRPGSGGYRSLACMAHGRCGARHAEQHPGSSTAYQEAGRARVLPTEDQTRRRLRGHRPCGKRHGAGCW